MKQLLLLYRFNPYHNRRIVRYSTTNEYIGNPNNEAEHIAAGSYIFCEYPKNFAYRDGVDTVTKVTLDNALETPDYCLVIDQTTSAIESRWFVMDSDLYSGKSTQLTLHRDMIADYYEEVLTAPCFIEKATLNPVDPFIFNSENITVNRIKKGETLIKDKSKCAWVVGYLAPNTPATLIESVEAQDIYAAYEDAASFAAIFPSKDYVKFPTNSQGLPTTCQTKEVINRSVVWFGVTKTDYLNSSALDPYASINYIWTRNGSVNLNYLETSKTVQGTGFDFAPYKISGIGFWSTFANNKIKNSLSAKKSQIQSALCSNFSLENSVPAALTDYDGQNIKIDNKYYKLSLVRIVAEEKFREEDFSSGQSKGYVTAINSMSCWDSVDSVATGDCGHVHVQYDDYYLEAQEITSAQLKINILGGERDCGKMPYKMFCIPYSDNGDITIRYGDDSNYITYTMAQDLAIAIGKAISTKFTGAQQLYDLQLLPYCPDQNIIVNDHVILMPSNSSKTTLVYDGAQTPNVIGAIYWCAGNTGTFDVNHTITVGNVKLDSITEMYRISSPNWNGQFEFNAAKNGGVSKLNVDFTYKPHTPYIHINPNFGRLYGEDFDDARGLICAGDFSLPQTSDAWNTYQIQNKNYQNQFQRDIESLELTQSIEMKKQKFQAGVGALTGAMSGATAGAAMGGLWGGVAGAVVGGAASAAGAAMDIKYQKQLNEEAIDYRQDQFGFQLENIKALPQNLTNVGGLTANNKIWPVVEHYSCTDEEKQAIEMKLHYNGMTVERIGTMADFLQEDYSYIKGKLIRLTINEDNHFIEMIANEINRGVFIK